MIMPFDLESSDTSLNYMLQLLTLKTPNFILPTKLQNGLEITDIDFSEELPQFDLENPEIKFYRLDYKNDLEIPEINPHRATRRPNLEITEIYYYE